MATGTGKTYTAFQIIHRLHQSGAKKKILYLADRNILIDQTMSQDFKPFKKFMTKIKSTSNGIDKIDTSYEIYIALYHQLVGREGEPDQLEYGTDNMLNLHYGLIHVGLPTMVDLSKGNIACNKERK